MDRAAQLEAVLDALCDQRATETLADLLSGNDAGPAEDDAGYSQGLAAFVAFMAGDHPAVHQHADRAEAALAAAVLAGAVDPEATLLVRIAGVLAAAVPPGSTDGADVVLRCLATAAREVSGTGRTGSFLHYLATEAALAAAQLEIAQTLVALSQAPHEAWSGHRYADVMIACRARVAVFSGEIDTARGLLALSSREGLAAALVTATGALSAATAADLERTRELVDAAERAEVRPREHLGRGVHLLLAFAQVALGSTAEAVRHLLAAGGGADLERLTIIDRLLGYELLVNAAIEADDLDAALAWESRAAVWEHARIAAPTVRRIRSRVAISRGDHEQAEQWARDAAREAAQEARRIEQAEAEIVLARARIAGRDVGGATRDLRAAVTRSDATGHRAVRLAATRELRPARRRLPPPAGGGWASLSPREADVARLILDGVDSPAIAATLHLSPATVRTHVTRVLTAFEVATRIGLLAAAQPQPPHLVVPEDLTGRQVEVARQVALGLTNQEIAAHLGIQVKSVEKHVSDVMRRWGSGTRFDLAHRWWGLQRSGTTPADL